MEIIIRMVVATLNKVVVAKKKFDRPRKNVMLDLSWINCVVVKL